MSNDSPEAGIVTALVAAMDLPGVSRPPVDVGGRWFSVEGRGDQSGESMLVVEADGARRVLLDPLRHNKSPGPSRGGWVVGPPGAGGEQYAVVNYYGDHWSDQLTTGLIVDVRTGRRVREVDPCVMGIGFLSPTEFVYEHRIRFRGHPTFPDGSQRLYLRRHDVASGADELFAFPGFTYDDNSAHGFVHSPDRRWLVVTEAADFFGLGNRTYLLDLRDRRTYVHGADRTAVVHPYFGPDGNLLLETDGEIRQVDLGDPAPEAVQAALDTPVVLMPAEPDTLIQSVQPVVVDDRQVLVVSRQVKGAYPELVIADPAAAGPQVVDLVSQVKAWPMLDGDSEKVLGPEGAILDLGVGRDGRPVFTFEGRLRPTESYAVTYRGPNEPTVVARQSANHEEFARRVAVPELCGRLYETTAEDGARVAYHRVARRDAGQAGPRTTVFRMYANFSLPLSRGFSATMDKVDNVTILGGGEVVQAACRGSGELGVHHFRAGHGPENDAYQIMDVTAVQQDLIRRGVTTPRRLIDSGASGAGPLLFALAAAEPALNRAIFLTNPATGMDPDRYPEKAHQHNRTIAYGDPDTPEGRSRLRKIDPGNRLTSRIAQGGEFFLGLAQGTKDDRVLPADVAQLARRTEDAIASGALTGVARMTSVDAGHRITQTTATTAIATAFVSFASEATGWAPVPALTEALRTDRDRGREHDRGAEPRPRPALSLPTGLAAARQGIGPARPVTLKAALPADPDTPVNRSEAARGPSTANTAELARILRDGI